LNDIDSKSEKVDDLKVYGSSLVAINSPSKSKDTPGINLGNLFLN
jgi:hypothetical protein